MLIILPVALIPIGVIVWFIYGRIFSYLEGERKILNDTMVYQVLKNINNSYDKNVAKLPSIISLEEIRLNVYRDRFANQLEEKNIDDLVNGNDANKKGLREIMGTLDISGVSYLINKNLPSLMFGTPFKRWSAGTANEEPNFERLMLDDPLYSEMNSHITISAEGAKNAKAVFGKLKDSTFALNSNYVTLMYPIVTESASSPDPDSTDYKVFLMILFTNLGANGFIAENVKDVASINQGTVYVLDYKNDILYCNYLRSYGGSELDPEYDNDPEAGIYAEYINNDERILEMEEVKALIDSDGSEREDYNSSVINMMYENKEYQAFVINSEWVSGMNSGVKVVFFYPREVIRMPINFIILQITSIVLFFVVVMFFVSNLISNAIVTPISKLDYATYKVAQGYLDVEINTESKDEIGSLYKNFKRMISTINNVLSNIQKSSNNLLGFKITFDKAIDSFEASIAGQGALVNQSTGEFNELNSSIKEVANSVRDSLLITKKSQNQVRTTNQIINEMVDEIKGIAEISKKISAFTQLINGISEQTRLLSLNAAIEASRAGEAGKGFNVVASEIRKLAVQSNQAATEISGLIKTNDKRIKAGVDKTEDVFEALDDINENFKNLNETVHLINRSAEEGAKRGLGIMQVINSISDESNKNSSYIEEISKTRDQLSTEVSKMRDLILAFKVESEEREIINDSSIDEKAILRKMEKKRETIKKRREARKKKTQEKQKKKLEQETIESAESLAQFKEKFSFFQKISAKQRIKTGRKKGKLPLHIAKARFENGILNKLNNPADLELIETLYLYDEFSEMYELKKEIMEADRNMLRSLLKKVKFK